jgi:hypothetical protein
MGSAFSLLGESMLLAAGDFPRLGKVCRERQGAFRGQGNYAAVGSKVSAGGERGSGMFILLFLILSF